MKTENGSSLFAIIAAVIFSLIFIIPSHAEKNSIAEMTNRMVHQTQPIDQIAKKMVDKGLVDVAEWDGSIVVDLKYATEDNFTGGRLYDSSRCYLRKGTALKLIAANRAFKKMGYRIKIYDAYRPYSVQKILWQKVAKKYRMYIADPQTGSRHNRGVAVDMTLVDSSGQELAMPTGFDQFGPRCQRDFRGCSRAVMANRRLLTDVMIENGFLPEAIEWWHFDDQEQLDAPILDVVF